MPKGLILLFFDTYLAFSSYAGALQLGCTKCRSVEPDGRSALGSMDFDSG